MLKMLQCHGLESVWDTLAFCVRERRGEGRYRNSGRWTYLMGTRMTFHDLTLAGTCSSSNMR